MAASDKNLPPSEESEVHSFLYLCLSLKMHIGKWCYQADELLCILLQFYHFMELKTLTPFLCIQDDVKEVVPLNFLQIMDQPADSPYFSSDEFRSVCLFCNQFFQIRTVEVCLIFFWRLLMKQSKHPFKCSGDSQRFCGDKRRIEFLSRDLHAHLSFTTPSWESRKDPTNS